MATLGYVTKKEDGSYEGRIATLSINAPVRIVPIMATSDRAPNFRILAHNAEVGAAWSKTSAEGKSYVSLTFDVPELPQKLYANLGVAPDQDDDNVFAIIWNRPA